MASKNPFDKQHAKNVARYQLLIDNIFEKANKEMAALGAGVIGFDPSKPFRFADYPMTKTRLNMLVRQLNEDMTAVIVDGCKAEWTLANDKNSELARRVFGDNIGRLSKAQYERYFNNHEDARDAFIARKTAGLNLSDRVWRYTTQYKEEMEMALDLGIRKGQDSRSLARDMKRYLKNPDALFRKVRDEHGQLRLSKAAQAYHPGAGVYRSAYKNALRLTGTETNIAYRTADHERWKDFDFVVGIEVKTSKTNHKEEDICDCLKGKYPKDFKFVGWHPQCRCYVTTIRKTEEEFLRDLNNDTDTLSENAVTDVPQGFKDWVSDNRGRISRVKDLPYFLRDNGHRTEDGGYVLKPLGRLLPTAKHVPTALEVAAARHAARTKEDIAKIKDAWTERKADIAMIDVNDGLITRLTQYALDDYVKISAKEIIALDRLNVRGNAMDLNRRLNHYISIAERHKNRDAAAIQKAWDARKAALAKAASNSGMSPKSVTGAIVKGDASKMERHAAELSKMTIPDSHLLRKPKSSEYDSAVGADVKEGMRALVGREIRPNHEHPVREWLERVTRETSDFGIGYRYKDYYSLFDISTTLPSKIQALTRMSAKELAAIPSVYRAEMSGLLERLAAADFSRYGYIGYQSDIDHAYNILQLSKSKLARSIGFERISTKMPVEFFEKYMKATGLNIGDELPNRNFYDSLERFIPLRISRANEAHYAPYNGSVTLGWGNSDYKRRMLGSADYRTKIQYHEFGHGRDALEKFIKGQAWKETPEWQDLFDRYALKMKREGRLVWWDKYTAEIDAVGGRWKLTDDQAEMLGAVTDTIQALDELHEFKGCRGHAQKYFMDRDKQLAEFIAHASEAYWQGNEYFKRMFPDLYEDMVKLVDSMIR